MYNIAIAGYGNLGRGVEYAVEQNADMRLAAVFTRRIPSSVKPRTNVPVASVRSAPLWADKIDALILCGGSAADLPEQGPEMARWFNTVDSYDTHARIPEYFAAMDAALRASGKLGVISAGWDPGLFSLERCLMTAILPEGRDYAFWGRGVSQGHSNAIRQIDGVLDAVQYTCPIESAIEAARSGANPELSTAEKHTRECYVALADGADAARVEREIIGMPYYFADYRTTVHFVTPGELRRGHAGMAQDGLLIRGGRTGQGNRQTMEYSLKLASNPEFTASILVAYARAVCRMAAGGGRGALTPLDVPPAMLAAKSGAELIKEML